MDYQHGERTSADIRKFLEQKLPNYVEPVSNGRKDYNRLHAKAASFGLPLVVVFTTKAKAKTSTTLKWLSAEYRRKVLLVEVPPSEKNKGLREELFGTAEGEGEGEDAQPALYVVPTKPSEAESDTEQNSDHFRYEGGKSDFTRRKLDDFVKQHALSEPVLKPIVGAGAGAGAGINQNENITEDEETNMELTEEEIRAHNILHQKRRHQNVSDGRVGRHPAKQLEALPHRPVNVFVFGLVLGFIGRGNRRQHGNPQRVVQKLDVDLQDDPFLVGGRVPIELGGDIDDTVEVQTHPGEVVSVFLQKGPRKVRGLALFCVLPVLSAAEVVDVFVVLRRGWWPHNGRSVDGGFRGKGAGWCHAVCLFDGACLCDCCLCVCVCFGGACLRVCFGRCVDAGTGALW